MSRFASLINDLTCNHAIEKLIYYLFPSLNVLCHSNSVGAQQLHTPLHKKVSHAIAQLNYDSLQYYQQIIFIIKF